MGTTREMFAAFNDDQKNSAEEQIKEKQKETDFDIREYPIEVIVSKFLTKLEDDRAEIFIPDYQRELIWKEHQQSRFIESILLNLPIPYLYVADVTSGENEGRLEIVDGSQRIRTLVRFTTNELQLQSLQLLDKLNGFRFRDLPLPRQLRFQRKTLRMIELIEVDEEARRQLFDRLNSGGTILTDMEKRFGSRDGPFMTFIRELAKSQQFIKAVPINSVRVKHRDYEEMILRFFAYKERYESFNKRVDFFLDHYLDHMNINAFDAVAYRAIFDEMLNFVEKYFPLGFRKTENNNSVPRIRFEAISVGVALALQRGCTAPADTSMSWLESDEFKVLTRSDASNSRPKVISRINYVRDKLLGTEPEILADAETQNDVDDND